MGRILFWVQTADQGEIDCSFVFDIYKTTEQDVSLVMVHVS